MQFQKSLQIHNFHESSDLFSFFYLMNRQNNCSRICGIRGLRMESLFESQTRGFIGNIKFSGLCI